MSNWIQQVQYLMNEMFDVHRVDMLVTSGNALLDSLPKEPGPAGDEYGFSSCSLLVREADASGMAQYEKLLSRATEEIRQWGRKLALSVVQQQEPVAGERPFAALPSLSGANNIPAVGGTAREAIRSQLLQSPREVWVHPRVWMDIDSKTETRANETEDWGYTIKHVDLPSGQMVPVCPDPLVPPGRAIWLCGEEGSVWLEYKPGPLVVCRAEVGADFIAFIWEAHWRLRAEPNAVVVQELPAL